MAKPPHIQASKEPVSVRAVMLRFVLTGFVALVIVSLVTAWVSRRVGTDQATDDAERVAWVSAHGVVEPVLTDEVANRDRDALETMDGAVRDLVLRGSLVRVKIWSSDGTIVYSDEPRLIGERFDLSTDQRQALTTGESQAEISDLDGPQHRFEAEDKLLRVYLPVATVEGTPMLFEAYFRYSGVTDLGRRLWGQFAPIALGALLALQLAQLPFAWRMATQLRSGQRDRELLLRRALDASEAERRRIASDLHDGVVQDLTGVSLSMAALGRQNPIDFERVLDASAAIRTSVKSLRSLLVEIYPPNLAEEGLETALGDLLSGLPARGLTTELAVQLDDADPSEDTAGLVYRVVQEAVRNVLNHAVATALRVEVTTGSSSVEVIVDDNGSGFTADDLDDRTRDGHVGLRSLGGLLADVGGSLEVLSDPAEGTRVVAMVPLAVALQ